MVSKLTVINETGTRVPRVPVSRFKTAILGNTYKLSVIYIGDKKSQALNKVYRKKNKPTNILSFGLSKHEGELYVNLRQIRRELALFDRTFPSLLSFLLIHGMFHLKGLSHGSTMERQEKAVRRRFDI